MLIEIKVFLSVTKKLSIRRTTKAHEVIEIPKEGIRIVLWVCARDMAAKINPGVDKSRNNIQTFAINNYRVELHQRFFLNSVSFFFVGAKEV
ncbi:hypothetical protein D3C87_1642180 [compost metagenome]